MSLPNLVEEIELDVTLNHTWVGDVNVVLVAPDNTEHVVFSDTGWTGGVSCNGDSSDLGGNYTFSDSAGGDWWAEATTQGGTGVLTPGPYRTSVEGGSLSGGSPTSINSAFAGVNPNGTWTLRVIDGASSDTGSVTDRLIDPNLLARYREYRAAVDREYRVWHQVAPYARHLACPRRA